MDENLVRTSQVMYNLSTNDNMLSMKFQQWADLFFDISLKPYYSLRLGFDGSVRYNYLPDMKTPSLKSIIERTSTQYFVLPVTLDYSNGSRFLHQAVLIFDLTNREVIFYEPYGLYHKYGRNYAELPLTHLKSLKFNYFLKYTTFHDKIGVSEGIQQIILEKNNVHHSEFIIDLSLLKLRQPKLDDPSDLNIGVVELMSEDADPKVAELYGKYNSKSCVSITLVELYDYFSEKNMNKFYSRYKKISYPNIILLKDLDHLINQFE